MSTTLATILVGLGYDLSALEKGSPEAFRLINQHTEGMSAQMKRSAREGAESFRLIDEALGIHISRPLTKLITQEFPNFAKAMGSVLGLGAAGALAVAGVEFFDKIAKGIEKAQKAQEELAKATENVDKVFEEEIEAYKNKDKAITAAAAAVDKLSTAEQAQAKAAQEASGWFSKSLAAVGDWLHKASSFQGTLNLEQINGELAKFQQKYDAAAFADSINKTGNAAKMLSGEFQMVLDSYKRLIEESQKKKPWWAPGSSGASSTVISGMEQLLVALERMQDVQDTTTKGVHDQDAAAAALKRQEEAARAIADLYRNIGESLHKLTPETDPLKKLADEIHIMRYKAEEDFSALGKNSNDALQLRAAHAALASYEMRLDQVLAKANADAELVKAQAGLPTKTAAGAMPQLPAAGAGPVLGAGGTAGSQFDTFLRDSNAQLKLAAEAYQDLLTPADQFAIKQNELNALLKSGLIDQTAYTAAIEKAREEMAKASDQIDTLMRKGGAGGGAKAFVMQWMGDTGKSSDGQFTFDLLNKGLQGFEDETVRALTGAKTEWKSFFEGLDQMVLKFLLNKGLADMFKMFAGSGIGKSLGLGNVLGGVNPSQIANTTALAANTAAVVANTAAVSVGAASAAAGGAGSAAAVFGSGIPMYADGVDSAPGGLAIVGEMGPELLNLPSGSGVVPNSGFRSGAMHVSIPIDARGAQMGVGEQIARALQHQAPVMITRAVIEAFETQRRTAH